MPRCSAACRSSSRASVRASSTPKAPGFGAAANTCSNASAFVIVTNPSRAQPRTATGAAPDSNCGTGTTDADSTAQTPNAAHHATESYDPHQSPAQNTPATDNAPRRVRSPPAGWSPATTPNHKGASRKQLQLNSTTSPTLPVAPVVRSSKIRQLITATLRPGHQMVNRRVIITRPVRPIRDLPPAQVAHPPIALEDLAPDSRRHQPAFSFLVTTSLAAARAYRRTVPVVVARTANIRHAANLAITYRHIGRRGTTPR